MFWATFVTALFHPFLLWWFPYSNPNIELDIFKWQKKTQKKQTHISESTQWQCFLVYFSRVYCEQCLCCCTWKQQCTSAFHVWYWNHDSVNCNVSILDEWNLLLNSNNNLKWLLDWLGSHYLIMSISLRFMTCFCSIPQHFSFPEISNITLNRIFTHIKDALCWCQKMSTNLKVESSVDNPSKY